MQTKTYIRSVSLYDENETREISLEKICEVFGLKPDSAVFLMKNESRNEEITCTPMNGYGLILDGNIGEGPSKDVYGLANVAFNATYDHVDEKEGFYTQVFPGLCSAAHESDYVCTEGSEPVICVNQQKRNRDDGSKKIAYYQDDLVEMVAAEPYESYYANTRKELM